MSSHTELELINTFYTAFKSLDYATMAECYHPEAEFEDAVFRLQGQHVPAMWHMLCVRAKDFDLDFTVSTENGKVIAHWEPVYTFSQTGKRVHNIIDAEFEFKDGKIFRHKDHFDFKRWSKQALGLVGHLLGGTRFLHNKVSQQAHQGLEQFMNKQSQYA